MTWLTNLRVVAAMGAASEGSTMSFIGKGRHRHRSEPAAPAPSNAFNAGRGINQFGKAHAHLHGHNVSVTYTKGVYCDTSVNSTATNQC